MFRELVTSLRQVSEVTCIDSFSVLLFISLVNTECLIVKLMIYCCECKLLLISLVRMSEVTAYEITKVHWKILGKDMGNLISFADTKLCLHQYIYI